MDTYKMKYINCEYCGNEVKVADDTIEVVCSNCFMRLAASREEEEQLKLSKYDPKDCKKLRKEKGITQKDLSMILGIPLYKISQFEGGHINPPQELADWIDSN